MKNKNKYKCYYEVGAVNTEGHVYIIRLPFHPLRAALFIVDAPPTGFKSTTSPSKATQFSSVVEAQAFMKDRGIFDGMILSTEPS